MLEKEDLDAVFIVTGYDGKLRPIYPALAKDCIERGCHVFAEKPLVPPREPACLSDGLSGYAELYARRERNRYS